MILRYTKTVVVFDGSVKEALLYFDHIIPVFLLGEVLPLYKKQPIEDDQGFWNYRLLPDLKWRLVPDEKKILPPHLVDVAGFVGKLVAVNNAVSLALKGVNIDYAAAEHITVLLNKFMDDFDLWTTPFVCSDRLFSAEDIDRSEIVISLASLKLVDVDRCSWEQIFEFRRDEEARDKLRRLRLFAYENYAGKSKDYVEDDILKRMADYDQAVKQWGFETTQGALNMLLNSKIMGGALTGSLVSTLFGAPILAVATAAAGGTLEIGRIALEVRKQRFALRKLAAENPVSYISLIKSKLEKKAE